MNPLRISIITPCLNQAQSLESTLCSVLDQNYKNLEYFIIDGGSDDGSVDIIRRYEKHLSGWVSENNQCQTDAINKGLTRCTGDIIAYINAGDIFLPYAFDHVAKLMSGPEPANWVVGQSYKVNQNGLEQGCFESSSPTGFLSYLCRQTGVLPHASSFWHADLFNDYGYFAIDLQHSFDYEFNCRLLAHGQMPTVSHYPVTGLNQSPDHSSTPLSLTWHLEQISVARRYMHTLNLPERIKLTRSIGYRQRCLAIEQSQTPTGSSLWSKVITKPWWLASSDIRQALIKREEIQAA